MEHGFDVIYVITLWEMFTYYVTQQSNKALIKRESFLLRIKIYFDIISEQTHCKPCTDFMFIVS